MRLTFGRASLHRSLVEARGDSHGASVSARVREVRKTRKKPGISRLLAQALSVFGVEMTERGLRLREVYVQQKALHR